MYVVVFRMICLTSVLKTCNKLNDWNTMYCINILLPKNKKIIYKYVHERRSAWRETFLSCIKEIECSSPLIFFFCYIFSQHVFISSNIIYVETILFSGKWFVFCITKYIFLFLILWTKYYVEKERKNFLLFFCS